MKKRYETKLLKIYLWCLRCPNVFKLFLGFTFFFTKAPFFSNINPPTKTEEQKEDKEQWERERHKMDSVTFHFKRHCLHFHNVFLLFHLHFFSFLLLPLLLILFSCFSNFFRFLFSPGILFYLKSSPVWQFLLCFPQVLTHFWWNTKVQTCLTLSLSFWHPQMFYFLQVLLCFLQTSTSKHARARARGSTATFFIWFWFWNSRTLQEKNLSYCLQNYKKEPFFSFFFSWASKHILFSSL